MRKPMAMVLGFLLLVSLVTTPVLAQTAQDVLNKMIDAQGGRKSLSALKDTTTVGNIEINQMGISGTVTMYMKEPNKMRMDMEFMGMVISQGYDGQKAWGTNPQTGVVEEMPESQAKEFARQAMGVDYLLNPEKYKITFELKPKATLDGKDYYVLDMVLADGYRITQYVDPSTYLIYKQEMVAMGMTGVEAKQEVFSSDYKKVGDTTVAHTMRIVQDGAESARITLTSITYNSKLDDSLFAMVK